MQVVIQAKISGFLTADSEWTCYRRNYISIACSSSLKQYNTEMKYFYSRRIREDESLVESFAVGNSARIDSEDEKNIELV